MASITDKAMLVSLSVEKWSARKHDKKVSDEVAVEKHALGSVGDVGRYNKVLIARQALADVVSIEGEARAHHYKNTLAWDDDGWRILPGANYFAYAEEQAGFRRRFDAAAAEFVAAYPNHVEEARKRLGDLFNEADYPSPTEVARRFTMETRVQPMPEAADFRVTLGDEEEARIRADIEARLSAATDDAMRDLWDRVHGTVKHMSERLHAYTPGERTGTFRDSMVGNLRELADILPRLNVTGDAQLAAVHQDLVTHLCANDAQVLRENPTVRAETKDAADDILRRMAAYTAAA